MMGCNTKWSDTNFDFCSYNRCLQLTAVVQNYWPILISSLFQSPNLGLLLSNYNIHLQSDPILPKIQVKLSRNYCKCLLSLLTLAQQTHVIKLICHGNF